MPRRAGGRAPCRRNRPASYAPFFLPGKVVSTSLLIPPGSFLKTEPGEYVAYFVALCACRRLARCRSCTMCRFPRGGIHLKLVRRPEMRCEQLSRNDLKPSNRSKTRARFFRFSSSSRRHGIAFGAGQPKGNRVI